MFTPQCRLILKSDWSGVQITGLYERARSNIISFREACVTGAPTVIVDMVMFSAMRRLYSL